MSGKGLLEEEVKLICLTHIHDYLHSWIGTGTKSGRVKLVLWAKFSIFDQKNCGLPFQLE
jgi:hypothetical protein